MTPISAVCVNGAKMRMIHTFCSSLPVFQAVAKLFARVSFTITGSIAKRENVLQKLKEQVMACHTIKIMILRGNALP